MGRFSKKKWKVYRNRVISEERKREIAIYCIKHQHLAHKQRAYYLGLPYGTYMSIFREMIAVYSVFILKDEIIHSLTEKSLQQTYLDTDIKK